MAKKRYLYVGLTVLLSLLIPTSVLSDAPVDVMDKQWRVHGKRYSTDETDSTEKIGGQPQVSSKKKPVQVQGIENSSSRKNSIRDGGTTGGAKPSGKTSAEEQKENLGTNNPSSRVLINDPTQDLTNTVPKKSYGTGEKSKPLPITSDNGALPSGKKTNSGNLTPSPVKKTEDNQSGSFNQNQESRKNIPGVVNSDRDKNILNLNSSLREPFVPWLLWWLPVGLLGLLLWWFWTHRRRWKKLDQHVNQYVDQILEQKIQNHMQLITHNLVNNNEELNQYFDRRLQQTVTNNSEISNQIVTFVANSTEINNKINKVYRDIDITIESIRNEWNQTFIDLLRQYVDELINIIGCKESFNILIANLISDKVDELLNQIIRNKNELTVIINNADRDLYEWTLGELMAIKGCLTDRQTLIEQLASFSAELTTKLECTPCADINTFKPFKPFKSQTVESTVSAGDVVLELHDVSDVG